MTYTYDTWGNITEKKIYAYTTATDLGTPTSTIPYVYGNSTWKDKLTKYNGQTISYDNMGNPTTYRGKTLTWNGKELTGVTDGTDTIAYSYDENGLRLQKTVNNVVTDYYYNGKALIGLVEGSDTLKFSYDAGGLVQAVDHNGTHYYYLRNGQGDVVKLIDGSRNTVVEYAYDSWGKLLSCTGTLATTLGVLNPFRYRGYVYDEETGFYYLKSRYYDPETCRFISADVLLSTGQGVLGHNTYAYCIDNPVNMVDDGGSLAAPWWMLLGDWGAIHRIVQMLIVNKYKDKGMESEYIISGGRIDLKDAEGFIWEVKPEGTPFDVIEKQLGRYLKDEPGTKRGKYISYYSDILCVKGVRVRISYWQPAPGVVYYSWDFADEEAAVVAYALYKAWKTEKKTRKVAFQQNNAGNAANLSVMMKDASILTIIALVVTAASSSFGGGKDRMPKLYN